MVGRLDGWLRGSGGVVDFGEIFYLLFDWFLALSLNYFMFRKYLLMVLSQLILFFPWPADNCLNRFPPTQPQLSTSFDMSSLCDEIFIWAKNFPLRMTFLKYSWNSSSLSGTLFYGLVGLCGDYAEQQVESHHVPSQCSIVWISSMKFFKINVGNFLRNWCKTTLQISQINYRRLTFIKKYFPK